MLPDLEQFWDCFLLTEYSASGSATGRGRATSQADNRKKERGKQSVCNPSTRITVVIVTVNIFTKRQNKSYCLENFVSSYMSFKGGFMIAMIVNAHSSEKQYAPVTWSSSDFLSGQRRKDGGEQHLIVPGPSLR